MLSLLKSHDMMPRVLGGGGQRGSTTTTTTIKGPRWMDAPRRHHLGRDESEALCVEETPCQIPCNAKNDTSCQCNFYVYCQCYTLQTSSIVVYNLGFLEHTVVLHMYIL